MRHALFAVAFALLAVASANAAEPVTVENFIRAETDKYFKSYVDRGGFGRFYHHREPAPINRQDAVQMNRDMLYSVGIFDLEVAPVTIHKPATGGRFQSIQIVDQDHFTPMVLYDPGDYTLTREKIGTRYVAVIIRTFVNANDQADIKDANAIQDQTTAFIGKFEIPDWDDQSRDRLRDALNVLALTAGSTRGAFGKKEEVHPVMHLLYTAYGWGGNPMAEETQYAVAPRNNDGKTPHALTVKDVPVDGFWSITVYNKDGIMEKNSHSINNVTAKKNGDGSITINFGRGSDAMNNIPIGPGWNYIVRLYRPHKEILDGSWTFPEAKPVQ